MVQKLLWMMRQLCEAASHLPDLPNTREIPEQYLGHDLLSLDISIVPEPGVGGIVSVVPKHKVTSFRHLVVEFHRGFHLLPDIGLIKRGVGAVDIHMAIPDIHGLPRHTDDAFYIVSLLRDVVREIKDNDIPSLGIRKIVAEPGSDHPVVGHDGVLHGSAGNSAVGDDESI